MAHICEGAGPVDGCDRLPDAFEGGSRLVGIRLRQQDSEFLAAESTDAILRAHFLPHCPCDVPEHLIADIVAERIVDVLEMVEVGDRQNERMSVAKAPCGFAQQRRQKGPPVHDARQGIDFGGFAELRLDGPDAQESARHVRRRPQETDRIAAVAHNLRLMGIHVDEFEDGMEIYGGTPLKGASMVSFGDHRIAMAFTVANLAGVGTTDCDVDDLACADVSYPGFLDDLGALT